jgi:hypothetical protein
MTNEDQITALEKQLSGLERLLDDAIGKTADDAVGDDGADDGASIISDRSANVNYLLFKKLAASSNRCL